MALAIGTGGSAHHIHWLCLAAILSGKPIYAPDDLIDRNIEFDYICIGSSLQQESIRKQIEEMGLQNKSLLFDAWYCRFVLAYNQAVRYSLISDNISLVKEWHTFQEKGEQCCIKLKDLLGKRILIHIIPYGAFGNSFKSGEITISDLQMGIIYKGEYERKNVYEISAYSNSILLLIQLPRHIRAIIKMEILSGSLDEAIEKLQYNDLKSAVRSGIDENADLLVHDEDYSFLKYFKSLHEYLIFDVGANVGQSSLSFLKNSSSNIVAIEPNPHLIEALNLIKKHFGNNRLNIINAGVAEHSDDVCFYIPKLELHCSQEASFSKQAALERVYKIRPDKIPTENDLEILRVPIISLDDLNVDKPVFFIKIDAEGYELPAIKGMKKLILRYSPIILLEGVDDLLKQKILQVVSEVLPYEIWYWDYMKNRFCKENYRGGINYFLLPIKNNFDDVNCIIDSIKDLNMG